jgi:hypothetical protein
VRLTRGAGREHCSVRERPFEKASGAGSLARAFLFGGETAVIKGKVGKDRGRKLMKVHQDRLGETAQAGCAMRGVRHGALSSAKVKLGPHSGPYPLPPDSLGMFPSHQTPISSYLLEPYLHLVTPVLVQVAPTPAHRANLQCIMGTLIPW